MALSPGTRLGAYEILEAIGSGGMGEVYRARDPRLGRDVAIKVLPAAATADPDRRARFEREARAVAALNHPNIVTIHAVEEEGGIPFFTMEYVAGRTLAQLLTPRGMPLDELLRIAIPLSDAVGAAHQHGILHRDLKPANVMVTAEGRVKVLDFGLAKLREAVLRADEGAEPTAATTGEGRILGTVAYMSPEQAEGKPLDQRSDVFSLGILLYEMATGQRPFKGDTGVSVLSAILKDPPGSVTDLRPDLPRDFGKIVKRALNKDPEHRYQTAKDLRNDLETLKEELDSGEALPAVSRPPRIGWLRSPWVAAGVLVAVIALAAAVTWGLSRVSRPAQQAASARPWFDDIDVTRLTTDEPSGTAVAVSRDGRYVAYPYVEGGRQGLRVRQVDAPATAQVVPPAEVQYTGITFSPDGTRLYYTTYPQGGGVTTLYAVPVLGGAPRKLIEDAAGAISFSPDGNQFAFYRTSPKAGSIVTANADGSGEKVLVTRNVPEDIGATDIAWSPDGRTIAASAYDSSAKVVILTVNTATGAVQKVGGRSWDDVYAIAWPREGSHLVIAAVDFAAAEMPQVWEIALPAGTARRITKDVAGYSVVSLTPDGRALVAARMEWRGTLWVAPAAQPDRLARIASVPDTVTPNCPVRWTADGRLLYTANIGGNYDVWQVRPDGTELRQLTAVPGRDGYASATPDSRYIVFLSDRGGRLRVWRMDPDGGHQTPLTDGPYDYYPVASGDSRGAYFKRFDQPGYPLYRVPIEGGASTLVSGSLSSGSTAQRWTVPTAFEPNALSPDGTLLLGWYNDDQQRPRLAAVPVGGKGTILRPNVELQFGDSLRSFAWAPDGRAITFAKTADGTPSLWRQPLDGGPPVRIATYPPGDPIVRHAWSRDGKLLALIRKSVRNEVVMLREAPSRR